MRRTPPRLPPVHHTEAGTHARDMPRGNGPVLCGLPSQYTFALAFFVVRIAIGWPVSFYWWGTMLSLLQSGAGPWWSPVICGYLLCNLVLNGLNAFWFYKIVKGALGGGVTQAEAKAGGDKKKGKKAQD